MSRIGNKRIEIPSNVTVLIEDNTILVKGPKGNLCRTTNKSIDFKIDNNYLSVKSLSDNKYNDSLTGLYRTLINNMIIGVHEGFVKKMAIEGVGYRAEIKNNLVIFNVGYSKPVEYLLPDGMKAEIDKFNILTLESIDKELLGLTAAKIRSIRKPEPYKGKGIRYMDEKIKRKVGKSSGKK